MRMPNYGREYHLQFFGPLKNEYVEWPEKQRIGLSHQR